MLAQKNVGISMSYEIPKHRNDFSENLKEFSRIEKYVKDAFPVEFESARKGIPMEDFMVRGLEVSQFEWQMLLFLNILNLWPEMVGSHKDFNLSPSEYIRQAYSNWDLQECEEAQIFFSAIEEKVLSRI